VSEQAARTADNGAGGQAQGSEPLRLAYVVARFPKVTETFVVRELNEIDKRDDIDAELFGLFPPKGSASEVHPSAQPWLTRVHRPSLVQAICALLRWTVRRPATVLSTLVLLLWGFKRTPRLWPATLGAMLVACAQAETMSQLRIQHIHAHFVGHTATAAWVIHRLTGIEYSVTAHAYDLYQDQAFLCRRLRDAQFVITISRFNANFIVDFCHGVVPPITVVRAGVDLRRFKFVERRLPQSGPVRALCVASLMSHKGHRVLFEALSSDDPQIKRIEVAVVGEGEERAALEAQVRKLGLDRRVRFLGSLPENRVAELLDEMDLFVLPSTISSRGRMEGVPVSLMEALACGVPAVATRISGVPELVEEGVTGTLAEHGDVGSMHGALKQVLDNPDRALHMAMTGRERVVREYDVVNSAAALAQHFLASGRSAPSSRNSRPAFIAWSRSERSPELAKAVGADCHVVFVTRLARPGLVPLRYLLSAIATTWFLVRKRPTVVVATNPPIFPALIAYLVGQVTRTGLVLDSHPRGFGRKGSRLGQVLSPVHCFLVRRARATLVPGPELAEVVDRWGGNPMIIHEAPPGWTIDEPPTLVGRPTVLWVAIYASDEPVAAVLEAARRLPEIEFMITGDVRRCPPQLRAAAPRNVEFTGFRPGDEFRRLIERADVVLVLSTEPTSVPRAAFEAVEGLRPLVLSDWPSLHRVFEQAVFVTYSAEGIARGVQEAITRHRELVAAAPGARERQRSQWVQQRQQLMDLLAPDR
jgi:colanic acid/amylovoran biosynthesis glycosyltransferase